MYDNLNEEQTRLLPARAFDAAGWDLLQLVGAAPDPARKLTAYEQELREDIEAIMLVKIPQIPSSRAGGSAPVYSFDEYMQRTPSNHADWKIVPVAPRPFPMALRNSGLPPPAVPSPVPLPIAGIGVAGVLGMSAFWRRRNKKRHSG